jgi:UDP-N-acetylglucosamine transferase subunit ALG13
VTARILVSVGTDYHPFDRVVAWADNWARGHPDDTVIVQYGTSAAPEAAEGISLLNHDQLQTEIEQADIVVCHGGPATITEARRHGHVPICVPRNPMNGEHVDDHQLRFVRHLARSGLVAVAEDQDSFMARMTEASKDPGAYRVPVAGDDGSDLAPGVVRVGELIDELLAARRQEAQYVASVAPAASDTVTVLYLGGQGRSGSTLLERAIGQLPSAVNVGELVHLWERGVRDNELCGCQKPFHDCEFWTSVGNRAFGGWKQLDIDGIIRLRHAVDRNRYATLLARPRWSAKYAARHRKFTKLLARLYQAIVDESGAHVIVDSSKNGSYAMLLDQVPGVDLRVVQVVRDSRAVAYAWSKEVERPEAPGTYMPVYGSVKSALYWDAQNALLEMLRAPRTVVRYEDFVGDPQRSLAQIGSLLDQLEPMDLSFLNGRTISLKIDHTVAGNPMRFLQGDLTIQPDEAWRSRMPVGQQRLVSALTVPLRRRYGYPARTTRREV